MRSWKTHLVTLTRLLLSISSPIFVFSGYTALYWAWVRGDLEAAQPYLPWARNFGMLAMIGATAALVILFSSEAFPVSSKTRWSLSLLATATIAFFSEFRNEGKFYFKNLVHVFGPGTWIHHGLNRIVSSSGDFLYRFEYSHWNDFLMGPAIVSVLFSLVSLKIYSAFHTQAPISLSNQATDTYADVDGVLRFARILMNVGLFWFFIQAWAEKAGYVRNHYSRDEVDLPFEFAGTMLGFWMARVLTKPLGKESEKFRSTLLVDLVASGVIGLLYTFVVGALAESVASSVAHSLQPVVPPVLDIHEYTPFQQHLRPFELLLLAGAMWWGLNWSFKHEPVTRLSGMPDETEAESKWDALIAMGQALGVLTGYLLIIATMLSILEPEGLGWTLATAGGAMIIGTGALLLVKHFARRGITTVFSRNEDSAGG